MYIHARVREHEGNEPCWVKELDWTACDLYYCSIRGEADLLDTLLHPDSSEPVMDG